MLDNNYNVTRICVCNRQFRREIFCVYIRHKEPYYGVNHKTDHF